MAITVVGSVAFDSIETPAGKAERCLGGAATYFSLAASFFTDVRVIAVVGEDFGPAEEVVFKARNIDTRGIERAPGKSFFWAGSYVNDWNEAQTRVTDLNVFGSFEPKIPVEYADSEFLFLANIDPVLQKRVREAMPGVKLVAGDTMNYWINDHKPALLEVLKGLDILLINDKETKVLAGSENLREAAKAVLGMGPKSLVVKHGEYGATLFHGETAETRGAAMRAPALLIEQVVDPTGAGDSFAGGFFGYLAAQKEITPESYRKAIFYGTVMGSFTVEKFGTERLAHLSWKEVEERFKQLCELTQL